MAKQPSKQPKHLQNLKPKPGALNPAPERKARQFGRLDTIVCRFADEVTAKADEIDGGGGNDDGQDWYSLALGFALGAGMPPEEAHDFARYIRYHTNLG